MDIYSSLLSDLGINHDIPPDTIDLVIHKTPAEIEYTWQCEQSISCSMHNGFGIDYKDEQNYDWRQTHRYYRKGRFKTILYNLLNIRGTVPYHILLSIRRELRTMSTSRSKIWNHIRSILKKNKHQKYYNMIPAIIKFCVGVAVHTEFGVDEKILKDFDLMHNQFNEIAEDTGRKYFPNIRYIALRLIIKYGVVYGYKVPLLRTSRKQIYLNNLFDRFSLNVDAKDIEDIV
jgi:hypothetical protein